MIHKQSFQVENDYIKGINKRFIELVGTIFKSYIYESFQLGWKNILNLDSFASEIALQVVVLGEEFDKSGHYETVTKHAFNFLERFGISILCKCFNKPVFYVKHITLMFFQDFLGIDCLVVSTFCKIQRNSCFQFHFLYYVSNYFSGTCLLSVPLS